MSYFFILDLIMIGCQVLVKRSAFGAYYDAWVPASDVPKALQPAIGTTGAVTPSASANTGAEVVVAAAGASKTPGGAAAFQSFVASMMPMLQGFPEQRVWMLKALHSSVLKDPSIVNCLSADTALQLIHILIDQICLLDPVANSTGADLNAQELASSLSALLVIFMESSSDTTLRVCLG